MASPVFKAGSVIGYGGRTVEVRKEILKFVRIRARKLTKFFSSTSLKF